ncbi:uncharacterized protein LOC106770118 [Vigna radiata var. radiata]|uniref:Uncharacterized protein LOC106770118 n=1 Tax=Vigna radiata var. radiata TaxID=3916 RepID=A0A1S3UZC7_VIGRR|nr:uncharacterized protein LOC106770118 [Vigna radiata var. radiata]
MLQVWFCEHFMAPEGAIATVPRFLHWMNRIVGDNIVKRVFEMGLVHVVDEIGGVRKDDKDVIEEEAAPKNYAEQRKKKLQKKERRESLMRTAEDQKCLIEKLKREVNDLEQELEKEKAKRRSKKSTADDGFQSAGCPQAATDDAFVSPVRLSAEEGVE